jgi:phosphatidylglycerophosphatase A
MSQPVGKPTNPAMFPFVKTFAKWLATSGGVGYIPIAPGTYGTIVGIPLVWLMADLPLWQYGLITAVAIAIAIWAANEADLAWGTHDCQKICIDETVGYFVTMLPVAKHGWVPLVFGFVLFRFFDQVKPPPVRWLDENLAGGYGVVLDDVAAGVMGAVVMWGLEYFGVVARVAGL